MPLFVKDVLPGIRQTLARQNLERLCTLKIIKPPTERIDLDRSRWYATLQRWTKDNANVIATALKSRAFGSKGAIGWARAFLPFMESCAVYLRDYEKLANAQRFYQAHLRGQDNATLTHALQSYDSAYQDIYDLAKTWGLEFVPLVDLINDYPTQGSNLWDGPYCGAFITTDAQAAAPFIGVAFKGTSPLNISEVYVDWCYTRVTNPAILQGVSVSQGVSQTLFAPFTDSHGKDLPAAYTTILAMLTGVVAPRMPNTSGQSIITHVTGHSLGASYCGMTHLQLMSDFVQADFSTTQLEQPPNADQNKISIGDQYTFGMPRIGGEDFADLMASTVEKQHGLTWRIVHDEDLVTQVPPLMFIDKPNSVGFYHIDSGVRIDESDAPQPIPSERGGPTPQPLEIYTLSKFVEVIGDAFQHLTTAYYPSLRNCLSLTAKNDDGSGDAESMKDWVGSTDSVKGAHLP